MAWICTVQKNYIGNDGINQLYTISIIVGRFNKCQWFSEIDANNIVTMVDKYSKATNGCSLKVNCGLGGYQSYTFNKYQKEILLTSLEKILKEETIFVE